MSDSPSAKSPKIIAIANQKGGVGKTTTTINLGAALSEIGHRVLLVDLDPQGNASTGLGVDQRDHTTYDLLLEDMPLGDVIQPSRIERVWITPATTDLSSADMAMAAHGRRAHLLHDALRQAEMDGFGFDYVLIDCPPSLNLLTINAMVAADSVLVPLQCEFFALEGLSQLILTIREVRESANPKLRMEGVLLTMYDARNNLTLQVEQDARNTLGDMVFSTVIPRNVRLSEAPSFALSVLEYDTHSRGSEAYRAFAQELSGKNH